MVKFIFHKLSRNKNVIEVSQESLWMLIEISRPQDWSNRLYFVSVMEKVHVVEGGVGGDRAVMEWVLNSTEEEQVGARHTGYVADIMSVINSIQSFALPRLKSSCVTSFWIFLNYTEFLLREHFEHDELIVLRHAQHGVPPVAVLHQEEPALGWLVEPRPCFTYYLEQALPAPDQPEQNDCFLKPKHYFSSV